MISQPSRREAAFTPTRSNHDGHSARLGRNNNDARSRSSPIRLRAGLGMPCCQQSVSDDVSTMDLHVPYKITQRYDRTFKRLVKRYIDLKI